MRTTVTVTLSKVCEPVHELSWKVRVKMKKYKNSPGLPGSPATRSSRIEAPQPRAGEAAPATHGINCAEAKDNCSTKASICITYPTHATHIRHMQRARHETTKNTYSACNTYKCAPYPAHTEHTLHTFMNHIPRSQHANHKGAPARTPHAQHTAHATHAQHVPPTQRIQHRTTNTTSYAVQPTRHCNGHVRHTAHAAHPTHVFTCVCLCLQEPVLFYPTKSVHPASVPIPHPITGDHS